MLADAAAPIKQPADELTRLLTALRAEGGNVTRAARAAGISRMRAYRLMEAQGEDALAQIRAGAKEER
jgi:transcriptional regulator of acetoin/glycerol metabolism